MITNTAFSTHSVADVVSSQETKMIFERGSEGESVAYLPVLNVSDVQGACPQEAHDGEDAGGCTGSPVVLAA